MSYACPGTEVPRYFQSVPPGRMPERQSLFESRRHRRRFTRVQLQKVIDLKISREGDQIALIGQNVSDLAMGTLALAGRSDFLRKYLEKILLGELARTQ